MATFTALEVVSLVPVLDLRAPGFGLNTPAGLSLLQIRQLREFLPRPSSQHSPNAAWSQATEEQRQSERRPGLRVLCKGLSDAKLDLRGARSYLLGGSHSNQAP